MRKLSWATRPSYQARAVLAIAAALLMVVFLSRHPVGGRVPMQKPTIPEAALRSRIKLELESHGEGLDIRWNPDNTLIKRAAKGRFVILQPDRVEQAIALTPDDLSMGRLYYRSPAERLEFRLELVDGSGRIEREAVLALSQPPTPIIAKEQNAPKLAESPTGARTVSLDGSRQTRKRFSGNVRPQKLHTRLLESSPTPAVPPAKRSSSAPAVGFFWR